MAFLRASLFMLFLSISALEIKAENTVAIDRTLAEDSLYPRQLQSRVTDGALAKSNQFPYQAKIYRKYYNYYSELICGATIIHQQYALTSAQCVYERSASEIWLIMGDPRADCCEAYDVYRIIVRDPYYEWNGPNDIALLQVQGDMYFHERISAISYLNSIYQPEIVNATGYGWPWYAGDVSPSLQYVTLNTTTNAICAEHWGSRITPDKICTLRTNGKGTCGRDAGGPLVFHGLLIGIIGWTEKDCDTTVPDVHTRVAPFATWISNIISGRYGGRCTDRY